MRYSLDLSSIQFCSLTLGGGMFYKQSGDQLPYNSPSLSSHGALNYATIVICGLRF
jgi:hypothetical protein